MTRTVVVGHGMVGHRFVESCLEDADVAAATYPVRVVDGVIQVGHA